MGQVINTNVMSLNAQRNLNKSQGNLQTSLQRLSSGLRINSAKDDAAGLAVSMQMSSQVKGLNQAVRNANDGVSMIQTAEGAMAESQNMLLRVRELAVQASNDTISDTERGYLNTEMQQLQSEINAIGDRTKFNGQSLLTGALSTTVDATSATEVGLAVGTAVITEIDVSGAKSGETFTFTNPSGTELTLTDSDGQAHTIDVAAGIADGGDLTLNFSSVGVSITMQNSTAGAVAGAAVHGAFTTASTLDTDAAAGSATLQVGADSGAGNTINVAFTNMKVEAGVGGALEALDTALTAFNGASTRANASDILDAVDNAVDYVSSARADLGAVQNRLESTMSNLATTSENISAARSRIVDADFAQETASLTRNQILQQAGMAMLSQANSAPQSVLSLLQ